MAIIYTYPEINEVEGEDLLLISDTSLYKRPTRSVTIDNLAAYIGTVVGVVQNLQSVLTVGNTYVSSDGYGTFTLNDIANNDGSITFVNPNEDWGYQISAEEGINITDGFGTNLMSIQYYGLSIRNGAQIMNIGTNALTATRNVYFPDASGTIALENVSEWYNVTGSRGLGNLLVKIGDYDNSGNGTFLSIDDADQSIIFTKGGVVESKFVFAATQDRDYTFPNADGTIALTSDIPTPGPSGSGTTNYTARWTNASTLGIGALYDNGTNVGIGTANPTQKLEVNGTVLLSTLPNNNGRLCLGSVSTNLFSNAASGHLYVSTNGSTRMTILNNGNVGIGTTSPSEKLDVEGNARVGQNNGFYINNQNVGIKRDSNDLVLGGFGNVIIKSSNTTVVNQAERMRITSAGNVGIGTTNPTTNLQLGSFGTADQEFRIESSGNSYFSVLTTNGVQKIYAGGAGTQSNEMAFYTSNSGAEGEAMRITSSGNVGIGTTSPSEKLHVAGYAKADTGFKAGNYTILNESGNETSLSNTAYYPMFFKTNNSTRMTISNAGNVGIGTTSPQVKLHVKGTSTSHSTTAFRVENLNNSASVRIVDDGSIYQSLNSFKATSFGDNAGRNSNGSNPYFSAFGDASGYSSTSGGYWTSVGASAGYSNTTGNFWNAFGFFAGRLNVTGACWNAIGAHAGENNTGGSNWVAIGHTAARYYSGGTTAADSFSNGVYIGTSVKVGGSGAQNEIVIGHEAEGNGSNTVTLGNDSITGTILKGNVGIGTTSPSEKLEVSGNIKVDKGAAAGRTAYLSDDGLYIGRTSALGGGYPNSVIADPGNSNNLDINARARISLKLNTSTVLVANDSGNVGIGTTSPSEKLEVSGKAIIRKSGSATAHADTDLLVTDATAASSTAAIEILGGNAGHSNIKFADTDSYTSGSIDYNHSSNSMTFRTNNSQNVIINSLGNVGIGTTSPGAKLSVNGNVKIEGTNSLLFGGSASIPSWAINHNGSDLLIDDQGGNIGSVLFNNDEGVALPRLTTTEINAISLPAQGLMAYNTTLNTICFYNGSSWQKVSHTSM